MRFRKRPKIVEAIPVANILAGDRHPYWLTRGIRAGKVVIGPTSVNIIIARNVKHMIGQDWIAHDMVQDMVYGISRRTMAEDYERLEDEVVK